MKMKEKSDTQQKRKWFAMDPPLSSKEKGVIANIWFSVSVVIWSIVLAPLEIKTVSNAGLEPSSIDVMTLKLFLWGIAWGFFFKWKFGSSISDGQYILLPNFIFAFFMVLLSPIARALLIAKYGI
jgi:hypothetical protein